RGLRRALAGAGRDGAERFRIADAGRDQPARAGCLDRGAAQGDDDMLSRADFATSMFSGARQIDVFNNLHRIFPVSTMTASPTPRPFARGGPIALPEAYLHEGSDRPLAGLLKETDTVALLVIEQGRLRYDGYWLTGGPAVNWMSMSVAK